MVTQYKHHVYVEKPGEATRDQYNDFVVTDPSWDYLSRGREETNGKGETVQTADVRDYKFSSLVQLPRSCRKVPEGTRVMVTGRRLMVDELSEDSIKALERTGVVRIIGTVAKFDPGTLHNRMWI